ncbi:MAG: alpha-glucuronidase [Bacteroidaceae bacterium]|nr:alpha-glucuronidase [Bacteroidaceae bacterium]
MSRHCVMLIALSACLLCAHPARGEDGSRLWLRYDTLATAHVVGGEGTQAAEVLRLFYPGRQVTLKTDDALPSEEGYRIEGEADDAWIYARTPSGWLYGAFALLRGERGASEPCFRLRILNHWDNIDGSIERGYAGKSIFWTHPSSESVSKGDKKGSLQDAAPLTADDVERIRRYAIANASIGINGAVLNNVNASPRILTREYLNKVKDIADILRPWGIRVYLSVNFASPKALGEVHTAHPLEPRVREWWQQKAKEIYALIPDFGGFLVKANSEGQPGPSDYGRSHAEGANMLADALKPYGGIVMWRSFVYGANHKDEDRVMQAVSEFQPLDGEFRDNVILQSKNGPLDFQPREPYAPVFDQMVLTNQMVEFQITQEYLGQGNHLVFLAPMWKEFFSFVSPSHLLGVAGVANVGDDTNWCGHHFAQANWYAFGRLAWNPSLTSEEIAEEWVRQTWEPQPSADVVDMMLRSREACVDYMMPLGLHHIFRFDHHYGPEPDGYRADYPPEWCPVYYHRADKEGVGFERSMRGSGATRQYREPFSSLYDALETCPEEYLLWFHHVPWNYRMRSGRTLWEELERHYQHGVDEVDAFLHIWQQAEPYVDAQRFNEVEQKLRIQQRDAREWQDVCLKYFGSFLPGE